MYSWVEMQAAAGDEFVTVLVDVETYERLDGRTLSIGSHGYAQMWNRPGVCLLHRWIMDVPPGAGYSVIVDHINHDVLDCRRSNLRVVSPSASNLNRFVKTRSLPRGVHLARSGKFVARFKRHCRSVYLGTFDCADAAALAVIKATSDYDQVHGLSGLMPVRGET